MDAKEIGIQKKINEDPSLRNKYKYSKSQVHAFLKKMFFLRNRFIKTFFAIKFKSNFQHFYTILSQELNK